MSRAGAGLYLRQWCGSGERPARKNADHPRTRMRILGQMLRHGGTLVRSAPRAVFRVMLVVFVLEAFVVELSIAQEEETQGYGSSSSPKLHTNKLSQSENHSDSTYSEVTETSPSSTEFDMSFARQVENMTADVFYNEKIYKIQYNVSWDAVEDAARRSYDLHIKINSTERQCCPSSVVASYELDKDATFAVVPKEYEVFSLDANCSYEILLIAVPQNESKNAMTIVSDIPACVQTKCCCDIFDPSPTNLTIANIGHDRYNASWLISDTRVNSIIDVQIILEERICEKFPCHFPVKPDEFSSNYALFNASLGPEHYTLDVSVYNNYSCEHSLNTIFKADEISNSRNGLWYVWVIGAVCVIAVVALYCYQRYPNKFKRFFTTGWRARGDDQAFYMAVPYANNLKMENSNWLYVDKEIADGNVDKYEFPRSRLVQVNKNIGRGAFGEVYLAKVVHSNEILQYVAVKTLRGQAPQDEMDDFLAEIQTLKKIGMHLNVVQMVGCCTLKEPYLMIMEYVPCGDLKKYLLQLRKKWQMRCANSEPMDLTGAYITPESPTVNTGRHDSVSTQYTNLSEACESNVELVLDHTELQNFAFQIANGMAHLEKIPITHRDLAARNILISEHKTLKISDFGMSRVGPYVNRKLKKLPLRWMAIEAINEHSYDNKTDVWAFAVVLWEIGTLGAFPYERIADEMILYYLINGKRLDRPEICTDELYTLMRRCWSHNRDERPSFEELVELLDTRKRRIYVDFNQLNPMYVFPPSALASPKHLEGQPVNDPMPPKYIEFA